MMFQENKPFLNVWIILGTPLRVLGDVYNTCSDQTWHASKKYKFRWIIRVPFQFYWFTYDFINARYK
jgi:hypothetical protein